MAGRMKIRNLVATLTISASALIGLVEYEGYTDKAVIPVKDDRPTIGFGSTYWEDGSPVKMGESITLQRALVVMNTHITREEEAFRKSLEGAYLHQEEFDLYMDFVYQFGIGNWLKSSMRRNILEWKYVAACDSLLNWKKGPGGYDCSTPGNEICYGVWTRQLERHAKCLSLQ